MFLPVIELSGVGRVQPPVHFSTPPAYSQKLPWGVRLNPPEQHSTTQCILLFVCIQRFPTRVTFRMIRSSDATTVLWIIYLFTPIDVTLADVLFLYIYATLLCTDAYYIICVCTVDHAGSKAQTRQNAKQYTVWHKINGATS